jgi:DNA replication and repair protein RecF
MRIQRLALSDFRNHQQTSFSVNAGLIALVGPNGAGKTNILEALSLLAPGRGLRGSPLADMIHDDADQFAVAATLQSDDSDLPPIDIGTGVDARRPGRRKVRINRAEAAASSLGEWLSVIWLTPAMDRLFVDGASERRRFLDRMTLALTPAHAHHASRYEAAMRQRTRLLTGDEAPDSAWLAALEAQMADHGAALTAERLNLTQALRAELAARQETLFAMPDIALIDQDGAAVQPYDPETLARQLSQSRAIDGRAGRALNGPHRHDLAVTHRAKQQAAARCSTGEQKAMLLSLVLSHSDLIAAMRGARPILLLDEIAAHLDPLRRAALFERLASTGGQSWMSGTEAALFADMPGQAELFQVEQGTIASAH